MKESKAQEQLNRIQWLLDEAGEQGYLTSDRILEAFPKVENDLDQLDTLFAALHDREIQVYNSEEEAKEDRARVEGGDGDWSATSDLSLIPANDTVGLYFSEMSDVPLLRYEEEVALAKQLEQGREAQHQLARNDHDAQERARLKRKVRQGQEARQHLIKANTRLVVSVAKRYRGLGLPFLDLIQAGNLGLIKATDRFDYRRGYKFGTYATWWIRQGITRALSQQGRTIRIPVHMGDRIRKLLRTAQKLEQRSGHRPAPEEIAEEAGLDSNKVRWMLHVSARPISLDKPVGDEEGATEFGSFIEDEDTPSPAQSVEQHLLREDLEEMLTALTPREVRVLRLRFGLDGDRAHTLQEVGRKLGVTRERARQIERKALRKLRHPRRSRKLRHYLS